MNVAEYCFRSLQISLGNIILFCCVYSRKSISRWTSFWFILEWFRGQQLYWPVFPPFLGKTKPQLTMLRFIIITYLYFLCRLKLYSDESKDGVRFKSQRTLENFHKFIKEHGSSGSANKKPVVGSLGSDVSMYVIREMENIELLFRGVYIFFVWYNNFALEFCNSAENSFGHLIAACSKTLKISPLPRALRADVIITVCFSALRISCRSHKLN